MQNYRKARKGEIPCWSCIYYGMWEWWAKRGRCNQSGRGRGFDYSYAVGKGNTCDDVVLREANLVKVEKPV